MKRLVITAGIAVAAAVPAALGLIGNASFAQSVPVHVPERATLLDDRGSALSSTAIPTTLTVTTDDHGGLRSTLSSSAPGTPTHASTAAATGDDRHRGAGSGHDDSTDDSGATTVQHSEAGDDHGGLRSAPESEPGDDKGGLRSTQDAAPTPANSGSSADTSGGQAGSNNDTGSNNDSSGTSGRTDDGSGHNSGGDKSGSSNAGNDETGSNSRGGDDGAGHS